MSCALLCTLCVTASCCVARSIRRGLCIAGVGGSGSDLIVEPDVYREGLTPALRSRGMSTPVAIYYKQVASEVWLAQLEALYHNC